MATFNSKRDTPRSVIDTMSPEEIRRQFIDQPMDAARQPVLETAVGLLGLMTLLPRAFADSQRREYERLAKSTDDEKDPRLAFMKLSMERAAELQDMASIGQARVERALVAVGTDGEAFHGFVQDGDLQPRAGLTVRLSAERGDNASKSLSATTDKDGYFSIALGKGAATRTKPDRGAVPVGLSARMADLLDAVNKREGTAAPAAAAKDDTANQAKVEIFDASGKLLHPDPYPLVLDGGSAYREYVIGDGDPGNAKPPVADAPRDTGKPSPTPAPAPVPVPGKTDDPLGKSPTGGIAAPGRPERMAVPAKSASPAATKAAAKPPTKATTKHAAKAPTAKGPANNRSKKAPKTKR